MDIKREGPLITSLIYFAPSAAVNVTIKDC